MSPERDSQPPESLRYRGYAFRASDYLGVKGNTMFKRLARILAFICVIQTFHISVGSQSEAKDLTDVLGRGLDVFVSPDGIIPLGVPISPAFAGAVAQAVVQEVPLVSVTPAFAYRYNPAVDIFERSTSVP